MFTRLSDLLRPELKAKTTNMRLSIPAEKKIAAFLMATSSVTYCRIANQLSSGIASAHDAVREVPRAISAKLRTELKLPTSVSEISTIKRGFRRIADLPNCVGTIDGSHIPWNKCPRKQYYEYRCYKGFESLLLLALATADRRII